MIMKVHYSHLQSWINSFKIKSLEIRQVFDTAYKELLVITATPSSLSNNIV